MMAKGKCKNTTPAIIARVNKKGDFGFCILDFGLVTNILSLSLRLSLF
jgi:hypothetical protein